MWSKTCEGLGSRGGRKPRIKGTLTFGKIPGQTAIDRPCYGGPTPSTAEGSAQHQRGVPTKAGVRQCHPQKTVARNRKECVS